MSSVSITNTGGLAIVTVSRPEALNALNQDVIGQLRKIMEEIEENPIIKGVILTGDGEKAFVAGADIKELSVLSPEDALVLARKGQALFKKIEDFPKPVIAAVNGFALGGGCELAMACHMRFAAANAKFGQPEINLGIIPGYGGTQRLTQLVGRGKALELLLTADMISADEAKAIGLVNQVYPTRDEMLAAATKTMEKIISKSPIAIQKIISAVNSGFWFEGQGYDAEARAFSECAGTNDFREGTAAFLEKRKAQFKGN
jgi:enoyl-CoA hydratase